MWVTLDRSLSLTTSSNDDNVASLLFEAFLSFGAVALLAVRFSSMPFDL